MSDGTRSLVRAIAGCLVCAAAVALPPLAAEAQQTIRLSPGQSRVLTFVENPSTGYGWAINRAASQGLDKVAVADGGFRPGAPAGPQMVGVPGEHVWTLQALAPGSAEIVFAYRRPWEAEAGETRRVVVDVAR